MFKQNKDSYICIGHLLQITPFIIYQIHSHSRNLTFFQNALKRVDPFISIDIAHSFHSDIYIDFLYHPP